MSIVHIRRAELAALRAQEPVAWLYRSITGLQRLHTEQGPMLKADMDAARDFPHAHSCIPLYAATHCTTPKVNSDERSEARRLTLYHATTPKKVQHYHASGRIIAPVRGFTTLQAAMAWACKTGRSVVLAVQGEDCHKLPDHHNAFGEAWWIDHDVSAWKCVFSPKDA